MERYHKAVTALTLATLKDGTRDGQLIVISSDHKTYAMSNQFKTLQSALDCWEEARGVLGAGAKYIDENKDSGLPLPTFDAFHSPLPRAYAWMDGSAYVNHVELVRKARGAEMPPSFWTDPLMYQGGSDSFLAPHEAISLASEDFGIDMEAEVAIITDNVPMGVSPSEAAKHIKLIMLVNDVSLRNLIPAELAKGFGFFQSKPSSSFSPFIVTPDTLGDHWKDGKVHLPLKVEIARKGQDFSTFGAPNAGVDMTFNFPALIAHAAKTRPLLAGSIIGSGTVSNVDRSKGSCCIAERRMLEIIDSGKPETPFLQFGDRVRITMGEYFGTIEQEVKKYSL